MECLVALFILSIIVAFTLPSLGNIFNLRKDQRDYLDLTNYSKTVTEKMIAQIRQMGEPYNIENSKDYKVDYNIRENQGMKILKVSIIEINTGREQVYETILPQ